MLRCDVCLGRRSVVALLVGLFVCCVSLLCCVGGLECGVVFDGLGGSQFVGSCQGEMVLCPVMAFGDGGCVGDKDSRITDRCLCYHDAIEIVLVVECVLVGGDATVADDETVSTDLLFVAVDIVPVVGSGVAFFECSSVDRDTVDIGCYVE